MIHIRNDQRGLLFERGNYRKHLLPGTYYSPFFANRSFSRYQVILMDVHKPFFLPDHPLSLFLHDEELVSELTILDVKDHELALHFEDGKFRDVYDSGKYAFWNAYKTHTFTMIDLRQPEVVDTIDRSLFSNPSLFERVEVFHVAPHERGILYYDHRFQRELKPGSYYFWEGPVAVDVETVDLRRKQLDMTGQEIMTADKIPLRLNFVCQYQVVDPLKMVSIQSFEEQIYIELQLVLRENIGTYRLDDLFKQKQEVGTSMLQRLQEKEADFGVRFLTAGIKDIILPGDVKEILNTVLIAEKKAQANLITRREETASTRSLLNTAKLMDENPTLYRLKELELVERISEKIGTLSLTGGGNLLDQIQSLFTHPSQGKDHSKKT
jgi:regulator of protease activity HflC (stomatin/prohibitin superfamily)